MIILDKPIQLNGEQLAKELKIDDRKVVATETTLQIDLHENLKEEVENIVKNHKPKPAPIPTIQERLAASGIDLDELRTALGL